MATINRANKENIMLLSEYRSLIEQAEREEQTGDTEAVSMYMVAVSQELQTALWHQQYKPEASSLAQRAEAIIKRIDDRRYANFGKESS